MGSHDHLGVRAQEGHVTNTRNDQEQGHDSHGPGGRAWAFRAMPATAADPPGNNLGTSKPSDTKYDID